MNCIRFNSCDRIDSARIKGLASITRKDRKFDLFFMPLKPTPVVHSFQSPVERMRIE
jgi:hypothetical protein